MNRISYIILISTAALFTGCTALKYVPEGERLYTGADVKIVSGNKVRDHKTAKSEAKKIASIRKPNSKILFSRPGLWVYYIAGTPKKEKGFRYWLKNKVGQEPVYMSSVDVPMVSKAIDAGIYNRGFFTSYNRYEVREANEGKTASAHYDLFLQEPYTLGEIVLPADTGRLFQIIKRIQAKSLLKTGNRYELESLRKERARIDDALKERGYYYFNGDYILFRADTSISDHKIRLYLTIKKNIPQQALQPYRIGEVSVYPDYDPLLESREGVTKQVIDSVDYYDKTAYIRPEPVVSSVFLRSDDYYARRKHNLTLQRLNGLGVFKFVNLTITADSSATNRLNTDIYLIPLPKKSIGVDIQGVSKSNNFIGPGLSFSHRNRNAFRGAELLILNLRTSFETQLNGPYSGQYTYEVSPRVELYFPRFIAPFNLNASNVFVPKTKFIFDYSYMKRVNYFDMNSFRFNFGYKWKESRTREHDLSLLDVQYFNISNTSQMFSDLLAGNVLLQRRFEKQYIAGISYSYTYNEQALSFKRNQLYFNGNVNLAGNLLASYNKLINGTTPEPGKPVEIAGIPFAQFARADIDLRDYVNLSEGSVFASRFIAGWGLPYGNSSAMPYVKRFFSGGAYSVRGFPAFSIGPGAYHPPDSLKNVFFLQQGGEIKLELNAEYRFTIAGPLRAAFFADAGNTWLNRSDENVPGGEFKTNRFMSEVAVGAGTGLRVDLSFFVIRVDLGVPLRKPWYPEGQRWVINQFDLSSPQWRRENLVVNLAFGYPF